MAVCDCNNTLSNTGTVGCSPIADVTKRLILVPMRDSSNNPNRIEIASIPSNTAIIALINQADDKKRYYPLPNMEEVTNDRGDSITQEYPSGKVVFIRKGTKTFSGNMIKFGPDYATKIESFACTEMGALIIDAQGNMRGDGSDPLFLAPIPIDKDTWNAQPIDTTDTTAAMITLGFQWAASAKDSDIKMLLASDFDADVNWLDYNGLLDLTGGAATSISVNGYTMSITTGFGSLASPSVATGLVLADFDSNELSPTPAAAPLASVTESSSTPGTYAFVWTTPQVSGDLLATGIASGTDGFDDTLLVSSTILIP